MVRLEDIAIAAIGGEALLARSLTQDWLAAHDHIASTPPPQSLDATIQSVSAGLVELFAIQRGEAPPAWAGAVGALDKPLFLVRYADKMPHLRRLCELESPEPLRRRHIYAPPDYLMAA